MDKPTDQPKTAKGYKPETFEVRGRYSAIAVMNNGTYEAADAEFDRWLASVKADALEEAASAANKPASGAGYEVWAWCSEWLRARAAEMRKG